MTAVATEFTGVMADGAHMYICTIVSKTEPESLTVTGADVDGLEPGNVIAAGSVLMTPSKTYIAFEDGVFTERA